MIGRRKLPMNKYVIASFISTLLLLNMNNLAYAHEDPPHSMIELAYFKCEASKNLEGGIYGKGPFKRFGPEESACSKEDWVRISHEEFKTLATQWYGVNWDNEIPWWNRELKDSSVQGVDSPWAKKSPYPYENKDSVLVKNSYEEKWVESPIEKHSKAVQKAKEVLKEWGQNPDKYEYDGKSYDYKILVSESSNFISVVFYPVGLAAGLERNVEIKMTKNDYAILSILPGS